MRKKNPMCNRCGVVPHPPLTRYCRSCKKEYMREYRARKKAETFLTGSIASQSAQ